MRVIEQIQQNKVLNKKRHLYEWRTLNLSTSIGKRR